jgi:hypothetical protein
LIYTSSKEKLNDLEDALLIKKEDLATIKKQAGNLVIVLAEIPDNPLLKKNLLNSPKIKLTSHKK